MVGMRKREKVATRQAVSVGKSIIAEATTAATVHCNQSFLNGSVSGFIVAVVLCTYVFVHFKLATTIPPENPREQLILRKEDYVNMSRIRNRQRHFGNVPNTASFHHNATVRSRSRSSGGRGEIVDFERQEGVFFATKIHNELDLTALKQTLCLLTYAYNNRPKYDIIVFSTEAIQESDQQQVRELVQPAQLSFVVDNPGLQEMVRAMNKEGQDHLLERCNVSSIEDLHWYVQCREKLHKRETMTRLGYTWQAEFRALHLWNHPSTLSYRYMFWLDSDAFCGKVWDIDPIAFMIRNDLVLLFANFPQGRARGPHFKDRFLEAFNRTLCKVYLDEGHLVPVFDNCAIPRVDMVHGFMHITSLDFYRSPPVAKWQQVLVGDNKFSREFDDQIAVTAAAAALAPDRSWIMRDHDIHLNVVHNSMFDGKEYIGVRSYRKWYNRYGGNNSFPEVADKCPITQGE